jgi:acetoin utilization deacetylase AcuC-like enzyme
MVGAPVFLEHPSSLAHDTGMHPEQPARIIAIQRELSERGWLGYERLESRPIERGVLAAVHPERYIDAIEAAATSGGAQLDPDTTVSEGSFVAALHSAGGAVQLVDLLLDAQTPFGFSCHRPPGHHALRTRAMGFCLFNNVAVAAQHALSARSLDRVLVFDWDVHHGNGTSDIFHSSSSLLYVSIHQWPLYPGTGAADDAGSGEGAGYTVNLPVPPGAGDELYRSLVDHVVVPLGREFEPQLVLISAGFDAHHDDPLADCSVTEAGFGAMAASIRRLGQELDAPFGAVLEGGYALGPLARSVAATLEALSPSSEGAGDAVADVAPLAREALARLAPWWPALAG